jgi:hypothetical protein
VDAGEQADKIILSAKGEDGVDQIVADTRFLLLDLEAVGEEGRQLISSHRCPLDCRSQA